MLRVRTEGWFARNSLLTFYTRQPRYDIAVRAAAGMRAVCTVRGTMYVQDCPGFRIQRRRRARVTERSASAHSSAKARL